MTLDSGTAERIAKVGIARAGEMGLAVSIAVVDDSGNTVCVSRMDGAPFISPDIALGKAFTAAAWRLSSGEIEKRALAAPSFFASVATMSGGRAIIRQGALPIVLQGKVAGAVGVSGATSEQDEEIARAGLTATL